MRGSINKKLITIGLILLILMIGLSGCLYEFDKEIKDNIKEMNIISVALDIEVLSQQKFNNEIVPNAGAVILFHASKDGVEILDENTSTHSLGVAESYVNFNIFPDEQLTITVSLKHFPGIQVTEYYNYIFFESQARLGEPYDRCAYTVEITLPVVEYPVIEL
jgi:hypothetical protein